MSLPAELRVVCHQLSSTPTAQLPNILPDLLRNVSCCQGPLSSEKTEDGKSDGSESSVLIHKLKTQVSTLLYGKSIEGRFVSVVLIKAIVAVGGWEILRGVESWVRGLLLVLGKQDPEPTKKLCVLSLTSIYLFIHEYQSLVREVTTPSLPSFVSSCLSLIAPKSSARAQETPLSLIEAVFESFCVLISKHPTIFRPYGKQINAATRPYLAPTSCDRYFVPMSLSRSARRAVTILYHTSPKNTSGEEWGKSVRVLVRDIHATADLAYRAVVEDWESVAGYVSQPVDVNKVLQGGGKSDDDLPPWIGIDAGLQRLEGMLKLLQEHFMHQTASAVNIPLDLIVDLLTRLMSVVPPTNVKGGSGFNGARLHPAIERNERDGLWAGLERIHVVSMEVYLVILDRLQSNFISLAHRCISQVSWIFSSQHHGEPFRCVAYRLIAKTLPLCWTSLDKSTVNLLTTTIRTCCKELASPEKSLSTSHDGLRKYPRNESSANADSFLALKREPEATSPIRGSEVLNAAQKLLPLFLSHLPQHHLQGYLRAELDLTAILVHNKEAMLASVLNPYLGQNGRVLPSILPHLCREFPHDPAVEALLRPRLPVLVGNQPTAYDDDQLSDNSPRKADEVMEDVVVHDVIPKNTESGRDVPLNGDQVLNDNSNQLPKVGPTANHDFWGSNWSSTDPPIKSTSPREEPSLPLPQPAEPNTANMSQIIVDTQRNDPEDESDESVHLTMDLSSSEDESGP